MAAAPQDNYVDIVGPERMQRLGYIIARDADGARELLERASEGQAPRVAGLA